MPLVPLASTVAAQVFFSVNALAGRKREACPSGTLCRQLRSSERPACCSNYSGGWDASNLQELLRASASAGIRPEGLAFGNELAGEHGIEGHLSV